jgi:MoxR-like ATPase
METGGFLYIEELNRAPEDALNTLLTAIADREIAIPRTGVVRAAPSFRVVASMNPYDNVGTMRLSTSITDRLCRLEIGYQDEAAEREIVARRISPPTSGILMRRLVEDGVAIVRATRHHRAVRQGSSVRGAIDLVLLARELALLREVEAFGDTRYTALVFDAMVVALAGRLVLDEAVETDAVTVLREIWESRFQLALAEPG